MADETSTLAERLRARFDGKLAKISVERDETTIEVAPDGLIEVCRSLRDDPEFRFEQLVDVCGVDYLGFGDAEWDTSDVTDEGFSRGVEGFGPGRFNWEQRPAVSAGAGRFAAVIHLLSIVHNRRLRVRCFGADDALPVVPSVTELWPGANWFEREAFDLYGIVFEGHPDLRRILTDYGFVGHPFRKDFPLIGNVEVRYDPEKGRVVYEPVSIDPRVGVPRVVRHDSRYEQAQAERSAGQGK
ncbi:NADH-quinone oxidoreductase subunit C [Aquimonas voraii]|uniref:NADH-quinone oxidoreductase subunit C n=1 Tax=Aquimonas voraii TaxID=265719 RepID=A0A1G6UEX7_9GAMM|nr:NADH-quinone oxidoreductase subunit C [Aquimonas voraii]SDD39809.1 NADH dehydrogenase subunit C [Aquimonas voraii]